ncbi:FHA domain-containing protein [Nocardia bovistercoris]|uniref:FHA domain-containing protein n=1 Tax=Nocardia bovistercoris TaxID=2785916 RepID=A0A931ID10_9NOCA|nr:FHA domain-containing protein [Nocardia bovistercoris]MBH0777543.1 FHA domain-containing protein [Nocardia bovistercoris]
MKDRQVEVVAGNHVLAVVAGAVLLVAHRGAQRPVAGAPAAVAVESLADLVAEAVHYQPNGPGAMVARQATRWLMKSAEQISPGVPIDFGIMSEAEHGGLAIFLHGAITAILDDETRVERFRGGDAAFTVDRVVAIPARAAALYVDEADGRIPEPPADRGIGRLVEGIAQAGGVIVWSDGGGAPWAGEGRTARPAQPPLPTARIDPEPRRERPDTRYARPNDTRHAERNDTGYAERNDTGYAERNDTGYAEPSDTGYAEPSDTGYAEPSDTGYAEPSDTRYAEPSDTRYAEPSDTRYAEPSAPSRERAHSTADQLPTSMLDSAADVQDPHQAVTQFGGTNPAPRPDPDLQRRLEATAKATALTVKVLGFKCARAHPSDPRSAFCTVCGMPVDQTQALIEVVRPPLGMLVLDDGMTYMLAADAVLGRDPEHSEAARRGLIPLKVDDSSGGMSRAHAEIHLVNWDVTVIDRGSTNGTRTRLPGYRDWVRLTPNQPMTLIQGTEVMIGNRVLRYEPAAPPPFGG